MLELLALALFQIASFTGSAETTQSHRNPTSVSSIDGDTGTGGWGNDVVGNNSSVPNADNETGTGGWGND